jgi:hypothetical protein
MVDMCGSSVTEPTRKEALEILKGKQLSQKEKRATTRADAMSGCQAAPPQGSRKAQGRLEAGGAGEDHRVLSRGVPWRKSARGTAEDSTGKLWLFVCIAPGCPQKHVPADCETFQKMSLEQRLRRVRERELCKLCLP